MTRKLQSSKKMAIVGIAVALLASSAAWADRDHDGRVFDNRYHHDHYYLSRGHEVGFIPHAAITVRFGGGPYYFHEGIWYRPHGPRYVVVAPPFGLFSPILPPFYTTLWVGGIPYYYANDVYYVRRGDGYVVTRPPEDSQISTQAAASAPVNDQVFIYPKSGQSEGQQATDRYECHSWANNETHYDPTKPDGGVATAEAGEKRAAYFRAMTACLEGRGYSVK